MSDELQNFGKSRCEYMGFVPNPEGCPVCGRTELCRCWEGERPTPPVVTPVVSQPAVPYVKDFHRVQVDSALEPPLLMPCLIPVEAALKALLIAAQGATVGFWVDHQPHERGVLLDFRGLLLTEAFGVSYRERQDAVLFSGGGRILMITDRKVTLGLFRGVTFARIWDVRRYGHQR